MSPLGTFSPGVFWPGGLLAWGIFVREGFSGGAFVRGVFCPGDYFPGRLLSGGIFFREGFCPGGFCPGGLLPGEGLLSGELMPVPPEFNAYTHPVGFLCLAS